VKNRSYRSSTNPMPSAGDAPGAGGPGRQSASAANKQPLGTSCPRTRRETPSIFAHLAWAGYLPDWPGPEAGERPMGYVIMLGDREAVPEWAYDLGIAPRHLLGAVEKGLGGCMIASVSRPPCEGPGLRSATSSSSSSPWAGRGDRRHGPDRPGRRREYWRDGNRVHHVPKRRWRTSSWADPPKNRSDLFFMLHCKNKSDLFFGGR
jgi:hypothetical protein